VYDVIVIGAGIGGVAAVYFLGGADQQVLVLERETLPRYKACGGGVQVSFSPLFTDMLDERASYFDVNKYISLALLGISKQRPTYVKPDQRRRKVVRRRQ
jgi:flavin-dependent dehydrogenase